jgi:sentrin-specific protease 1
MSWIQRSLSSMNVKKIFDVHKIIIPINNDNTHWTLAVVSFSNEEMRIEYLDSLAGNGQNDLVDILVHFLKEEADRLKFTIRTWVVLPPRNDIPRQVNGLDCGVFMCYFANFMSVDAPLTFTAEDIPHFRRRMITDVYNGHIA